MFLKWSELKWPTLFFDRTLPPQGRIANAFLLIFIISIPIITVLAHKAFAPALLILSIACATHPKMWGDFKSLIANPHKNPLLTIKGQAKSAHTKAHLLQITVYAFILFCIWILVSTLWAPLDNRGSLFLILLLPAFTAGPIIRYTSTLTPLQAKQYALYFCVSVCLTLMLLAFEVFTNGLLRHIIPPKDMSWARHKDLAYLGRGTTAILFLLFPAMVMARHLTQSWLSPIAIFCTAAISAFGFSISSNALGLIAGLISLFFVWRAPTLGMRIITVGVILTLWVSPFVTVLIDAEMLNQRFGGTLPVSWLQRFYIWETVGDAIFTNFPLGGGADYARFMSVNSTLIDIPGAYGPLKTVPTHPHNIFLQIWLELGLMGVILITLVLFYGAKYISSLAISSEIRATIAAIIAISFISFMVEASLWQVWRISIIAIAAFFTVLCHKITNSS